MIWVTLLVFGAATMPEFIIMLGILYCYITLAIFFSDIGLGESSIPLEHKKQPRSEERRGGEEGCGAGR